MEYRITKTVWNSGLPLTEDKIYMETHGKTDRSKEIALQLSVFALYCKNNMTAREACYCE